MSLPRIAIIELGSQYTLLIERSLRELGYRSIIMEPKRAAKWLDANPVNLIVLSGGFRSVYDSDALFPPKEILAMRRPDGKPAVFFGICYGTQWLTQEFGGSVEPAPGHREYGPTTVSGDWWLFNGIPSEQTVWASHGDTVMNAGKLAVTARSKGGGIAGVESDNRRVVGVQFHPEVDDTVHGKTMLKNLLDHAECVPDWKPSSMISTIQEGIEREAHGHIVLGGFSGGVDSSTLTALSAPVLKDRLRLVTLDAGQLREGEVDEIRFHADILGVKLDVIDARAQFGKLLSHTTDAENKREIFKLGYAMWFVRAAGKHGASMVEQATLGPDVIESGGTGGDLIKSHHNVGLDLGPLLQMHPVSNLFKYEIRALARELGLPESISNRQPFPGPGEFIRTIGIPATPENVTVTRWADARVTEIVKSHGIYDQLSQLVVAYFGTPTSGVKGDKRSYVGYAAVRAVVTTDFMTAKGFHFPEAVVNDINSVIPQHPMLNRAMVDSTPKPPGTTEFE